MVRGLFQHDIFNANLSVFPFESIIPAFCCQIPNAVNFDSYFDFANLVTNSSVILILLLLDVCWILFQEKWINMRFKTSNLKEPKHSELVSCVSWASPDDVISIADDHKVRYC